MFLFAGREKIRAKEVTTFFVSSDCHGKDIECRINEEVIRFLSNSMWIACSTNPFNLKVGQLARLKWDDERSPIPMGIILRVDEIVQDHSTTENVLAETIRELEAQRVECLCPVIKAKCPILISVKNCPVLRHGQ